MKTPKYVIIGAGYVGLSNALLLARNNQVEVIDINKRKIKDLKEKISPIQEPLIIEFLKKYHKNLAFSSEIKKGTLDADVIILCLPTDFDQRKASFNLNSLSRVITHIDKLGYKNLVVIRSTIPVGYTEKLNRAYSKFNIAFFPEFLREGLAMEDTLNPSRIICGSRNVNAIKFCNILSTETMMPKTNILITSPSEAEAIKLFSNSYLAMRVSFFNELDSFAIHHNLNSKEIIKGISLDSRIGNFYNNPSFGYGGYCLPKDVKQLSANFKGIRSRLINSIDASNETRKEIIIADILKRKASVIGIFRLAMKKNSDNIREAAIIDIILAIKRKKIKMVIFEPMLKQKTFKGIKVLNDLDLFKKKSDLVLSNRVSDEIMDVKYKIYTRDIFKIDF